MCFCVLVSVLNTWQAVMHHSFNTDGKNKRRPFMMVVTAGLLVTLRWFVDFLQFPSWLRRSHGNELWHFLLITSSAHGGGKKVACCSSALSFFKAEKPIYKLLAYASGQSPVDLDTIYVLLGKKRKSTTEEYTAFVTLRSPHTLCVTVWNVIFKPVTLPYNTQTQRHSRLRPTESELRIFLCWGLSNATLLSLWTVILLCSVCLLSDFVSRSCCMLS